METSLISIEDVNISLPQNQKWDYKESVTKVRSLVFKWKNISVEILRELYIARKTLSSQGVRNDLSTNGEKLGWLQYLDDIDIPHETARRWLKQYDFIDNKFLPKEIESDTLLDTNHKCPSCSYEW